MKKFLCIALALCFLLLPAACQGAWNEEDWAWQMARLSSQENNPVPAARHLPLPRRRADHQSPWLRVLLTSTDSSDLSQNFGRGNVMLLCAVHLKTGAVRLVSLPENCLVCLDELPGRVPLKYVNCFGGPYLTLSVLEQQFDVSIPRYCAVNLSTFEAIVDTLGGIDLPLSEEERSALGLSKEARTLTGSQALRYARMRRNDGKNRPLSLIQGLTHQLSRQSTDDLMALVDSLLPAMDTNLTFNNLLDVAYAVTLPETGGSMLACTLALEMEGSIPEADRLFCKALLSGEDTP